MVLGFVHKLTPLRRWRQSAPCSQTPSRASQTVAGTAAATTVLCSQRGPDSHAAVDGLQPFFDEPLHHDDFNAFGGQHQAGARRRWQPATRGSPSAFPPAPSSVAIRRRAGGLPSLDQMEALLAAVEDGNHLRFAQMLIHQNAFQRGHRDMGTVLLRIESGQRPHRQQADFDLRPA